MLASNCLVPIGSCPSHCLAMPVSPSHEKRSSPIGSYCLAQGSAFSVKSSDFELYRCSMKAGIDNMATNECGVY